MKNLYYLTIVIFCQLLHFSLHAQLPIINVTTKTNPSNGYTFIANYAMGTFGTYYLLILDKWGRIVYAKSFPNAMNGSFLDFKPQPNNKYSFFSGKKNCYYIMDKFFNIIDTVVAKNGFSTNVHELVITNDNRFFLIADEIRVMDLSSIVSGGNKSANVTGNVIQELDSNGNLVFQWKTLDNLSLTDYTGDLTAPALDFTHTNSLFPDTDSTLLISNPGLNEITKINLKNGNIIWRFGLLAKSNQFTFTNDTLGFVFQHYVCRLPNGNITLFDNGHGRYARAVEYKINEANKTAELVFQYRNNPDIVGPTMGSAIRLPNGNTFIGWGSALKMTEVDTSGTKVFEATFNPSTYRALKFDIPNPISNLLSGPSEICKGQTATYIAYSCNNCSYSWNVTNGTIISGQGTNTLVVKWSNEGEGTVRLTKTNSLNQKDYFLLYVTILPVPKAQIGVEQFCQEVRFNDNSSNSIARLWNFGDGDTSSLAVINHKYNASGSYQIQLTVLNSYGCSDSTKWIIIIPDSVKADFIVDSIGCTGEKIIILNNSNNADSFYWNFGNSFTSSQKEPPALKYDQAGTYEIKLVVFSSDCKDSITKKLTVFSGPTANFGFTKNCNSVRLIDSSVNISNRIWEFGDGNTSSLSEVYHRYDSSATYKIKLKVFNSNGCYDSVIKSVFIPDSVNAEFIIDSAVCVNETVSLVNQSTNADNYFWDLGNSMSSALKDPGKFFYDTPGTYKVRLLVSNSECRDSMTRTIIVNPNPEAHFNYIEICQGAEFFDSSVKPVSHLWDFGDGETSNLATVQHVYNLSGTYQVKLKITNSYGCSDSNIQTLIITDSVKALFMVDSVSCVNENVPILNNSSHANNYLWFINDSLISDLNIPQTLSFPESGFYKIRLIASNSLCADTVSRSIVIYPAPESRFVFDEICNGAIFIDSSINAVNRLWDFGDGNFSVLPIVEHKYLSAGTYQVKLKISDNNGCKDSNIQTVIVYPSPKANFSADLVACDHEQITLINNSTNADHFFWDLGDSRASTLPTPQPFFYNKTGIYRIKLIAFDSLCVDSFVQTISVMPVPEAKFYSVRLSDFIYLFIDSTIISSGKIVAWEWNFGDSSTSVVQNPIHFYCRTGNYTITLCVISEEGCRDCYFSSVDIKSSGIDITGNDQSVSIFPNPNTGIFTIKSMEIPEIIIITDALGNKIFEIKPETNSEVIDLSAKPSGIYFVRIRLENQEKLIKIIH